MAEAEIVTGDMAIAKAEVIADGVTLTMMKIAWQQARS